MSAALPQPMKWSSDRYLKLVEDGVFQDEPVELLFGDILKKMSPSGSAHVACILRLTRELTMNFPTRGVGIQCTVKLSDGSVVDPDAWVTKGPIDDYDTSGFEASDLDLVIEVADSSLKFDRGAKLSAYALAGIPEYWVINLIDRIIEVYSSPIGDNYGLKLIVLPTEGLRSPTLGALSIDTKKLFPKA